MFIVTHACILTSNRSTVRCPNDFNPIRTLSYHSPKKGEVHGFG